MNTSVLYKEMFRTLILSLLVPGVVLSLLGCGRPADGTTGGSPALLALAERGDVSALDALLNRRADVDVRDSCRWTPLMKAAVNGHGDAVARLLAAGAAVDATDQGGYTPLLLAASNNHADVVALLLRHGAMIDAQEQTQGFTALIWAAKRGHLRTVETLLQQGADTTLPDFEGKTAADRAAAGGHDRVRALFDPPSTLKAATGREAPGKT
jgi:ankyrin repeat protein